MSVLMDGFVIGTQQSVVITNNSTGNSVGLDGRRTSFSSEPREKLETSEPVDQGGLVEDVLLPGGWQGTIDVDRKTDTFSAFYAYLENEIFYAGAQRQYCTILSLEPTADGSSTAIYQYTKVVFHGYKPGTWERGRVRPSVSFVAQQRIKVQ